MKLLKEMFCLKDKVALVTGGAGHLGHALSESLAELGAKVIIGGRDKKQGQDLAYSLSEKYNGDCRYMSLDVSQRSSIDQTVSEIIKNHGKIDILVNNAAYGASGSLEELSDSEWEIGIDGTVNQAFRCINSVIPHMIDRKKGSIINIASMYGVVSPNPQIYGETGQNNPPNYGTGKAAVIQLTKYIACHYGVKGVRANCISPGPFPKKEVHENKEFIHELSRKTPLGRVGRPEELKGALAYLASDASSYVTGQNLCVDGGWTSW